MRLATTTTTPAPPAAPVVHNTTEQAIVDGFRADRIIEQVHGLGGPRVAGTADAKRAAELIRATAEANGWQAHIELVPASRATRGKDLYNVVAERRGTAPHGERGLVLAGAHFDTVAGAYGANDDGSGTAALLEGTRVFAQVPTRHDLRFVWFDGEEDGLLGSRAYVAKHADALKGAKGIVVAEMLGSPGGAPKLVYTDRASSQRSRAVTDAAARNGLRPQVVVDPMAGSDHLPFARLGIPAFVVASAAPGTMRRDDPNYHRPSDTPDKLNPVVLEASGDLFGLAVNAYANAPSDRSTTTR